jgi:NodT family efflux transporter outer membrane factor (OMF) lipoprotein
MTRTMTALDVKTRLQRGACVVSLLAAAGLLGCASQGDLQTQAQPIAAEKLGLAATSPDSLQPEDAWWQTLGDAQLDQLVKQALAGSPSMQAVLARLERSKAGLVTAGAASMPQIQAVAELNRQRFSEDGFLPKPAAGATLNSGTLQLEGTWEADLFGRHRAEFQAAVGQNKAAQADVQAARVWLSTQVARSYVQLARLQAQREVAARTLAQRDELLRLVRQRVQAGLDTLVELKQGEGALPDARQQIEAIDEQIMSTRHALAALTAQPMEAVATLKPSWPALKPQALPAQVPLNLLGQRADVMALRWRAEAAGAQADAARTLFYPNLNINAYIGLNAIGLQRLFDPGTEQWGVMPAIDLPLFDGDRRRARLQTQLADQDAAIANYNQAVIDAVREVADHIGSAQSIERQQAEQAQAQLAMEAAYDVALQRYKAGLGPYLTVLSAEGAVLQQRRLGVELKGRALDTRVGLAKALGGHWPTAQPASLANASPAAISSAASN